MRDPPKTFEENHPLGSGPTQLYIAIRELRPSDAPGCQLLFERLDWVDISMRFGARRFSLDLFFPKPLAGQKSEALIAVDAEGSILGVINIVTLNASSAEIAIIVRSDCKRRGIGRALVTRTVERAKAMGLSRLIAYLQPGSFALRRFACAMGFRNAGEDESFIKLGRLVSYEAGSQGLSGAEFALPDYSLPGAVK